MNTTMAIIRGAMMASIDAKPLSMEKVTIKPPRRRIGALTPRVWELCINESTLYESLVRREIREGRVMWSILSELK